MTLRYLKNNLVINLTPQFIQESAQQGLCLVAKETLPDDIYLQRQRWRTDIASLASYVNITASDFVFDEENESPDDYLKYCLQALEEEFDADVKYILKNVILNFQYDDVTYWRWWQSSYQSDFVHIIRRVNDTDDMVTETLKRIQSILRTEYVANTNKYEIIR